MFGVPFWRPPVLWPLAMASIHPSILQKRRRRRVDAIISQALRECSQYVILPTGYPDDRVACSLHSHRPAAAIAACSERGPRSARRVGSIGFCRARVFVPTSLRRAGPLRVIERQGVPRQPLDLANFTVLRLRKLLGKAHGGTISDKDAEQVVKLVRGMADDEQATAPVVEDDSDPPDYVCWWGWSIKEVAGTQPRPSWPVARTVRFSAHTAPFAAAARPGRRRQLGRPVA